MSHLHRDGTCDPTNCRYCDEIIEQGWTKHSLATCGGYKDCGWCQDEHDCDKTFESGCPVCLLAMA